MSALVSSLPDFGAVSALPGAAAAATPPAGEAVANGSAITLYAHPSADYGTKLEHTLALLRAAAAEHAGRIVQATSLGVEDMVITDLIACHALPIAIATLETGKLHRETAALIGRIEQRYGLAVAVYRPREEQVVHLSGELMNRAGQLGVFD